MNSLISHRDYEESGLSIQQAMIDMIQSKKNKMVSLPKVRWGNHLIQTSDCIRVSNKGRVRLEFLDGRDDFRQGVDIDVNGGFHLADGSKIKTLRTWRDSRYSNVVEYDFISSDDLLWVWNVYEVVYESKEAGVRKWTDNAGFWIEESLPHARVYHCSAGPCSPPDFEALVFRLTVI